MINKVLDMPWRVSNEIRRLLALPYIRLMFKLHGILWGEGWRIFGMPVVQRHRGSTIVLGDNLILRSWPTTNPLMPYHPVVLATRNANAIIQVGNNCGLTGTTIVAVKQVQIGNNVLVGANCTIVDTDFHPLTAMERQIDFLGGKYAEIIIEDDVFIGMNCLILKGVTIGRGSVVGAGSVVTYDVPPSVIIAGNPARVVKELAPPF